MAYQILQIAGGGSRLMNMDHVVSLHIEAVETAATGDLKYFVYFTTSLLKADCRVKSTSGGFLKLKCPPVVNTILAKTLTKGK